MNSNKVIVSGKNATTSIFISISENQKEEAERLEYEIKNSHTSSEEDCEEEAEPEGDFTKNQLREQLQHMRNSRDYYKDREAILNNALDKKDEEIKKLDEENTKLLSENELQEEIETLQEEIKTWQLSVTNHEKKYEGLQNLYCEEKQKRIDLEKQSKIDESELIWYKNSCARLQEEEFKSKEMRIEANKYDNKIYNKLEKELKKVKNELEETKIYVQKLEDHRNEIDNENTILEAEKDDLEYDIKELKKEVEQLKKKAEDDFEKIEERSRLLVISVRSLLDSSCESDVEIKELKKQLKEVSEEADMAVHNHSVDAKALFKEIAENRKLKKELKEEKIFRRDNEDNFFRLLDEHRRLEKVMKNVDI
jgi:chromosome segregation ATPase